MIGERKAHRPTSYRRKLLIAAVFVFALLAYYLAVWYPNYVISTRMFPVSLTKVFVVDTDGCKIPWLNPMDPSTAHLSRAAAPLQCAKWKPPLVVQGPDGTSPSIIVNVKVKDLYGANVTCSYQTLHRLSEDYTAVGKTDQAILQDSVPINDEFIQVVCVDSARNKRTVVFDDFFAFIQRKPEVEKRCEQVKTNGKMDDRLNVLILGIDSVSKNNFLRLLRKTNKYLRDHLTMVEMLGYNKIGHNTFPVMLPFLTGFTETEVNVTNRSVDFLPFVWKDYIAAGYRTLFSEDNANTAIFRYVRKGFAEQPSDYYWRPFKIGIQNETLTHKSQFGCIKGRSEADALLNWTLDFFDNFPSDPLFALTMLSHMSHDTLETLSIYDESYFQFLKQMNERNHLNKTIVFFYSDHGFNYGSNRRTYVGRMEGKLPFLFILLPPWFPSKYPHLMDNLKLNVNRLITVLDLHAMLKDIAVLFHKTDPQNQFTDRGHTVNLFQSVVSSNRTCSEAKIPVQLCACASRVKISGDNPHVIKAAETLVQTINGFSSHLRSLCAEMHLDSIKEAASQLVPTDNEMEKKFSNYQIIIQVTPGGGLFEASIWHLIEEDEYVVDQTIERVNRYGNQSDCITESSVKRFCFCNHL